MKSREAGKGSSRRPTNFDSYSAGYDRIFNKGEIEMEYNKMPQKKETKKKKKQKPY